MATEGKDDQRAEPLLAQGDDGERESSKGLMVRVWEEAKKIWVVAGPVIFTRFSTFGVSVISQAFMGHIGSIELAAYALVHAVLVRFANGVLVIRLPSQIFFLNPYKTTAFLVALKNPRKLCRRRLSSFSFRPFFMC